MGDIDLSGVTWSAKNLGVGAEFNGNGYAISNLSINSPGGYKIGLFAQNSGTIKNLTISNANIVANGDAGILVGFNNATGKIENCSVSGYVAVSLGYVGGVAGNNLGEITNSFSSAIVQGGYNAGGLVGKNENGRIKNSSSDSQVSGSSDIGGLVGFNSGADSVIENAIATGKITASGNNSGGLVGQNQGTIKNASASGEVENTATSGSSNAGGLVGLNSGAIENANATGNVSATRDNSGGLVGSNSGTINNVKASGNITSTATATWATAGGLVGLNSGSNALIENAIAAGNIQAKGNAAGGLVGNNTNAAKIKNASASGNIFSEGGHYAGGLVAHLANGSYIENSYALGEVHGMGRRTGGFVGYMSDSTIINSYAKGNVQGDVGEIGGFAGNITGTNNIIDACYSIGNVTGGWGLYGFAGQVTAGSVVISNSYSLSKSDGADIGFVDADGTLENCFALTTDESKIGTTQNGLTYQSLDWFEDGNNLRFLGDAYDYYYNPPELWSNREAHPEEFTQFQVGANSGEKNTLNMNMTFRMYDFYGDVSSVESASDTLERVDAFKERLSEHRSMIGAVRNRLDSVLESQSIRLENLNSSYSTIVDTDFAAETAALTRSQILQQATSSLLSQANFMPNIALQLLS